MRLHTLTQIDQNIVKSSCMRGGPYVETIGDYIARDNPARAIRFLRELREKCLGLADLSERFPLVPRYRAMMQWACGVAGVAII